MVNTPDIEGLIQAALVSSTTPASSKLPEQPLSQAVPTKTSTASLNYDPSTGLESNASAPSHETKFLSQATSPRPISLPLAQQTHLDQATALAAIRTKSPSLSPNFAYLANPSMTEWDSFGFLTNIEAKYGSRSALRIEEVESEDLEDPSQVSPNSVTLFNQTSPGPSPSSPNQLNPLALQDLLNRIESNVQNPLRRNPTDSHEIIYKLFDRHTCGILSIKDGPTENPWRSIMWPLALEHGALYNAIAAMTKFHNAKNDKECRELAMGYMRESFSLLAKGLSNKSIPLDIALATTLALALAETWDRHISTGIAHIRGASAMLRKLIPKNRFTRLPQWLQFLFNSWLYLDVVSRLTSDAVEEKSLVEVSDSDEEALDDKEDDNTSLLEESNRAHMIGPQRESRPSRDGVIELASFLENNVDESSPISTSSDLTNPSVNDSTISKEDEKNKRRRRRRSSGTSHELKGFLFMGQGEEIDPLMGCAQTLFPLIGRVATLVHKVRRLPKNTLSIVSEAVELKRQLELWNPTLSSRMTVVEDPTWDLNSCLSTAEAYRYAGLLYLHQAVPEVPSLTSHELAEKVMMLLASIPTSSRTCIIHIFPLLVAGCEAENGEEREWVKDRWNILDQRMHIGNINCTIEVVKEVWMRKDIQRRNQAAVDHDNVKADVIPLAEGTLHRSRRSSKDIASSISSAVSQAFGHSNSNAAYLDDGIKGWSHWSVVMHEWGWEVLLG